MPLPKDLEETLAEVRNRMRRNATRAPLGYIPQVKDGPDLEATPPPQLQWMQMPPPMPDSTDARDAAQNATRLALGSLIAPRKPIEKVDGGLKVGNTTGAAA